MKAIFQYNICHNILLWVVILHSCTFFFFCNVVLCLTFWFTLNAIWHELAILLLLLLLFVIFLFFSTSNWCDPLDWKKMYEHNIEYILYNMSHRRFSRFSTCCMYYKPIIYSMKWSGKYWMFNSDLYYANIQIVRIK